MWPILFLMLFAAGCAKETATRTGAPARSVAPGGVKGKKVVMIIAHRSFRDEELMEPRRILEEAGVQVVVASSSLSEAVGMLGTVAHPTVLVKDIKPADYDAVIYVGGSGAQEYWNDPAAQELARQTVAQGKLLAAICFAPVTLANAGVLTGKKATVWPSESGRLTAQGADYTGSDVEVVGRIITGNGPEAAERFGQAVLSALGG